MPKQPSCDGCFVYYGIFFLQFFCQADFHAVETAFPDLPSPQGDIEQHHQREPEGGTDGADIAVLIGPGLGDKFFDDNIDHCTGGESEDLGQHRCYERGYEDGQYCADRLGNTGEGSAGKGFAFRGSACGEGG